MAWTCAVVPGMFLSLQPLLRGFQASEHRIYGGGFDIYVPPNSVEIYHKHNERVRQTVPKDQLLEFQPTDGWKPLCEFLGVPVPKDEDGRPLEYPRTNETQEVKDKLRTFAYVGLVYWALLVGAGYAVVKYVPSLLR